MEELKEFWDTFYVPNNATLVIVGSVSHEKALELSRRYFGWMPAFPEPPRSGVVEPAQAAPRAVTVKEAMAPAPLARYIYRTVPARDRDSVVLEVLAQILGNGESSRLYHDLVKEKEICQEAYAYAWSLEEDGLLILGAELAPGGDLEGVFPELDEQVARIIEEPVSAKELEKTKNRLRRRVVTDTLRVENKAREIGQTMILEGDAERLNERLGEISAVTVDDVQRVARVYLAPERRTSLRVVPDKTFVYEPSSESPEVTPQEWACTKEEVKRPGDFPTKPPLQDLLEGLPEIAKKRFTLANGMEVVVIPNHEVPFTTVMLGLKQGAWTEDAAHPGVSSAALEMLTKGTKRYTAAEMAELVEFNALTLKGGADSNGWPSMDVGQVTATALAEKFPLAMELLAEVVREPVFPEEELEILKKQRELTLSVNEKDPRYIADREFRRRLYQEHPYARQASGELADMEGITRERVMGWWNEHLRPDEAVLYVAGDVKPKAAFGMARKFFGDWASREQGPEEGCPEVPGMQDTHIYLVDVPGAVQSQIRVGQVSITRMHKDYHASRVFAQIFGSGFNSRLNRSLRVERGLTYSAWGTILPRQVAGEFRCVTFTRTDATVEALKALLEVIGSMATEAPTVEEMESAKAYLVGSFAKQLETPQDALSYQWIIDSNGLPDDYLQQALNGYKATQSDDVVRIAREVIQPDKLTIVVVGDAASLAEPLESVAPLTVVKAEE